MSSRHRRFHRRIFKQLDALSSFRQGIGIFLAGSNSSILDCNIQQPTVDTGIMLGGSNNAVLGCSNITDSILVFSNENLIAFNNASSDGIGIGVFGNNNQIYVNTTKNNSGGDGIIVFSGALGNKISGNKSFDNTPFDMEDENPGCGTNVWVGNKFNTANESCIH